MTVCYSQEVLAVGRVLRILCVLGTSPGSAMVGSSSMQSLGYCQASGRLTEQLVNFWVAIE